MLQYSQKSLHLRIRLKQWIIVWYYNTRSASCHNIIIHLNQLIFIINKEIRPVLVPYNPAITPLPLCMLGLGKSGEGAYTWDHYISVWQRLPIVKCHVGARSLYFLWLFGGQNSRKTTKQGIIWHKQLVAVATVFIGLSALLIVREGGLIRKTKLPMQQLKLNMQGGLCASGGA